MKKIQEIEKIKSDFYFIALQARIQIARIGEKDIYNWWDVEAQSDGGLYALKRLFKNTYIWAAMEISMRSAISKIERLMKESDKFIHLFKLTPDLDSKIWNLFYQLKQENKDFKNLFLKLNHEDNILNKIVQSFNISDKTLKKIRSVQIDLMNPSIAVLGTLRKENLNKIMNNKEILHSLIVGFTIGKKDELTIPTYRIT